MKLGFEHEGRDSSLFTFEVDDWKTVIEGIFDATRDCTGVSNAQSSSVLRV